MNFYLLCQKGSSSVISSLLRSICGGFVKT